MFPPHLATAAHALVTRLKARRELLAVAESCTGGLVAGLLTEIAGASDVFERGYVTYSNRAKSELLGVDQGLIVLRGAVSEEVARAMALGAVTRAGVAHAIAVTGIAGPSGGTAEKPVGLVHFAAARRGGSVLHRHACFPDTGRAGIRMAAVAMALDVLAESLDAADRTGR